MYYLNLKVRLTISNCPAYYLKLSVTSTNHARVWDDVINDTLRVEVE